MANSGSLTERFATYFNRDVAQLAANSIQDGSEIEFRVAEELFTFTKEGGVNSVNAGPARDPQLIFTLGTQAAESILAFPSDDIGEIGVHIAKMVISKDPDARISVRFACGFFTLLRKGYFGVLTVGGSRFASFLAAQGLNGIGAMKSFLGKMKRTEKG